MDSEELPESILVHRVGNRAHGVCVCGGQGSESGCPESPAQGGWQGLRAWLGRGKESRLHPQASGAPGGWVSLYLPPPSWLWLALSTSPTMSWGRDRELLGRLRSAEAPPPPNPDTLSELSQA